ncbi:hypothetical protein BCR43DRAFT_567178 [Syncephalastrum racemosum]|uniref:F/Y rich C-terminus-domain-containing protein n=1 Tax=Syncephalastrum racemosum TaxID=13706 RepID=A0A1X2H0T5_SYNRA|nr:hypothetical protein BCR43DRAFT_567178 [Syncephalastrum racemosum]
MSRHHMSIHTILQDPEPQPSLVKVKIFCTFKDTSVTDSLCTFMMDGAGVDLSDGAWIKISLKECLSCICSSCPDQLMRYLHQNIAVYTAKHAEFSDGWDYQGLLSAALDNANEERVIYAKLLHRETEVAVQLEPVRVSSPPASHPLSSTVRPESTSQPPPYPHMQQQQQQPQQTSLPPMRSLFSHPRSPSSELQQLSLTSSPPSQRPYPARQTPSPPHMPPLGSLVSQHFESSQRRTPPPQSSSSSPYYPYSSSSSSMERRRRSTHLSDESVTGRGSGSSSGGGGVITSSRRRPHSMVAEMPLGYWMQQQHSPHPRPSSPPGASQSGLSNKDMFYHRSRKKKRDTKPPNANDVRPFFEIEKDNFGRYILPVEIDSWTVLDLGHVVWDRPAFHNQRYIYPVGYCVKKWYRSMVDPHSDTQYTCQILDGGNEPIFSLEAEDNPGEVWRGPTPTTVWTIAVRRAFAIRQMDYGHNPVGPDFFGLRKNTIAKMIQDLPNANRCENYIWQNFEPTSGHKNRGMRRNVSSGSTSSASSKHRRVSPPAFSGQPQPQAQLHQQQQQQQQQLQEQQQQQQQGGGLSSAALRADDEHTDHSSSASNHGDST